MAGQHPQKVREEQIIVGHNEASLGKAYKRDRSADSSSPPLEKRRKRFQREQRDIPRTRGRTSVAPQGGCDIPHTVVYSPAHVIGPADVPTDAPQTIVAALVACALPCEPPLMKWSPVTEAECRPWTLLTNPWGVRFPGVAAVLSMVRADHPTTATLDGLEEALLAEGISSSDQIILSPEEVLRHINDMGLAFALMLQNYAKRIVFPLLGLRGGFDGGREVVLQGVVGAGDGVQPYDHSKDV
ncbi:hypothetical protein DXG01_016787 [Tephrocybe rancida]|nr:hypothetical protein DXG01_016787 [Tephrocybe rancida]